ncbi:MAG: methylisocitrate lyase [Rhodanobacteraceae bacterium]|nr:methylisocitrate lyase [Rhodanobacteraceae bacterium]
MSHHSAGARMRAAMASEKPLQLPGAINAYAAMQAERAGFKALYVSGAGIANASYGLPDLGMTSLDNVCEDIRRISGATELPLLVDADTGWGAVFNIQRTVKEFIRAGAAACHIEDQVQAKRCGHRPGKAVVAKEDFADRIKAAVDGRIDDQFMIVARTDALAVEGIDSAIERSVAAQEAGADVIFAEACTTIPEYQKFISALKIPVLANLTEFGKTPYFTVDELGEIGVAMIIYPLSAFRAMAKAAEGIYGAIRNERTQKSVVDRMQTRMELYEVLGYHAYEQKIDSLFGKGS